MTEKTNIDDIIGIVKTEEKTDSVELKKEYYKSRMTENKRYSEQNLENHLNRIYDNHEGKVIFDDEIIDLLNEQEETIQTQKDYIIRMGHGTIFEEMKRLKERNQRQYYSLKKISDLIYARDWKTLESIVEGWEEFDRLSQAEFGNYGGVDD